nr:MULTISPECIES: phytase [Myxococcaceae]
MAGTAAAQLQVQPTAETDGVGTGAVSGVAFWPNPSRPEQSLVLLADRNTGLYVQGLNGSNRQFFSGVVTGVDVHDGFRFGTATVPLVAAAVDPALSLFAVVGQPDGGASLQQLRTASSDIGNVRTVKLYASSADGRFFAFVGNELGQLQQLELSAELDGGIAVTPGRLLSVPGPARAVTVDERAAALYVAEVSGQLWRFDAAPEGSDAGSALDLDGGTLGSAVQGLALYALEDGRGYLVSASGTSGTSTFTVLDRDPPHAVRGTFQIAADGGIDAVETSLALAIDSAPLGTAADGGYPSGVLVAVDGTNSGGAQNAKLVAWQSVAQAFTPPLATRADAGSGDGGTVDAGAPSGGGGVVPPGSGGSVPPGGDDGTSCSCTSSSVPGAALLALSAVLLQRRRRRSAP